MFGKKKRAAQRLVEQGVRIPAEILAVDLGRFVRNTNSGVGGSTETVAVNRTLQLRLEPPGAAPYEVTVELGRDGPPVPLIVGARTEVAVDAQNPQHVAVIPDAVYTLPGGRTYQPGGGTAGELSAMAEAGDVDGILRKVSELAAEPPPPPTGTDPSPRG